GQIDRSHAALAERRLDGVTADARARLSRGRARGRSGPGGRLVLGRGGAPALGLPVPVAVLLLRFSLLLTKHTSLLPAVRTGTGAKNRSEYMGRVVSGQGSSPQPARLSTKGTRQRGPVVNRPSRRGGKDLPVPSRPLRRHPGWRSQV